MKIVVMLVMAYLCYARWKIKATKPLDLRELRHLASTETLKVAAKGNSTYRVRGRSFMCEYILKQDTDKDRKVILRIAKQYGVIEAFFDEQGKLSDWISIPKIEYAPVYPRQSKEQETWVLESILGTIQHEIAVSDQGRQRN